MAPRTKKSKSDKANIVIGLDPGTGVSSPMGFSAFNADTGELLHTQAFWATRKPLHHRLKEISDGIEKLLHSIMGRHSGATFHVFIESFYMRGKGGETLQRMIGSVMGRLPYEVNFEHVQNTTVKLLIAEHGHATKEDVATGLKEHLDATSYEQIKYFVEEKLWDQIDATAIGAAGWLLKKRAANE